jgi:hypothetical protein
MRLSSEEFRWIADIQAINKMCRRYRNPHKNVSDLWKTAMYPQKGIWQPQPIPKSGRPMRQEANPASKCNFDKQIKHETNICVESFFFTWPVHSVVFVTKQTQINLPTTFEAMSHLKG